VIFETAFSSIFSGTGRVLARRCQELASSHRFPPISSLIGFSVFCFVLFRLFSLLLDPKIFITAPPSKLLPSGISSTLTLFAILVDPSPRLSLKSRSAPLWSSMDESSASTWKLWRLQITKESSSADRDSSLAPFDVVVLVLEALNSVTRMLHSVVPPPLLVRKRRTWLNLMGLRFGPSPSLLCPPSCPLPKALKPTKTSADLCPRLLRPWSCFNSILNSPNFLKLSSFRDCYGRLPVMVMMDLVWISCYLSQNLVASSYCVVRLRDCPSLISSSLEVVSLWKCPRLLLPV